MSGCCRTMAVFVGIHYMEGSSLSVEVCMDYDIEYSGYDI
jgi:hypothetical protein